MDGNNAKKDDENVGYISLLRQLASLCKGWVKFYALMTLVFVILILQYIRNIYSNTSLHLLY